MKIKSIYVDTSVISALFDQRTPERRSMTEEFFKKITGYKKCISSLVKDEINASSGELLNQMMAIIQDFEILIISKEVEGLADEYIKREIIPENYRNDAIHIAVAVINNVDFLVSWNFKHVVKVKTRKIVNLTNELIGYPHIELIAPPEL